MCRAGLSTYAGFSEGKHKIVLHLLDELLVSHKKKYTRTLTAQAVLVLILDPQ